ncbi:MAG: transporter, partial [Chitinispirillaceae bacterium]
STQAQEAKKIQDNSFLVEEAYNQEDGVIQHIQTFQFMKDKTWGYSFTQEWPVPKQAHQFSYTIPVNHPDPTLSGLGDILLNYRYQLVFKESIALAPRLSLLLPSGNYKKGFGSGATGFQINIPLSTELSDKWVTHWNLGSTFIPNSKNATGAHSNTFGFNFGTSFIYLLSEKFNFMFECVWNSSESVQADGTKTRNDAFFINPGVRFAINFKSGLQIVPGIAMPIGLGPSENSLGVFAYLSFEHPLF